MTDSSGIEPAASRPLLRSVRVDSVERSHSGGETRDCTISTSNDERSKRSDARRSIDDKLPKTCERLSGNSDGGVIASGSELANMAQKYLSRGRRPSSSHSLGAGRVRMSSITTKMESCTMMSTPCLSQIPTPKMSTMSMRSGRIPSTTASASTDDLATTISQTMLAFDQTAPMPVSQAVVTRGSRYQTVIAWSSSPSTKKSGTAYPILPTPPRDTDTIPRSLASTRSFLDLGNTGRTAHCETHATPTPGTAYRSRTPIFQSWWPRSDEPDLTDLDQSRQGTPPGVPTAPNTQRQDLHPSLPLSPQMLPFPPLLPNRPPPPPDQHQHPQSSSAVPQISRLSQLVRADFSSSSQLQNAAQLSKLPSALSQDLPLLLPITPDQPSSPVSPTRTGSSAWSGDEAYDTPLTSPEASPVKRRPQLRQVLCQLDGGHDSSGDVSSEPVFDRCEISPSQPKSPSRSSRGSQASSENDASQLSRGSVSHSRMQSDNLLTEDATPLTTASPAKRAHAFPFPHQSASTPSRHPSLLLQHCERNATPRQRRLMLGGMTSPDRFIASRVATPTKEGFILTDTGNNGKPGADADPFAPTVSRTVRMAEQYATLRAPAPPIRTVGAAGTRVREAQDSVHRTPSRGAVWSVGGTAVTEGIRSTTNGRGGRVTSGTNAPHYGADFLRRRSQTDEQATHGRRLAHALDISQAGRLVDRSSPATSPTSPVAASSEEAARVRWRDGRWERPAETTRLCYTY